MMTAMNFGAFIGLIVLVSIQSCAADIYSKKDANIKLLEAAEFQQKVIAKGDFWLIHFYSQKCTKSVGVAPIVKEASAKLKGLIRVGVVDIDSNGQLSKYASKGTPVSVVFNSGKVIAEQLLMKTDKSSKIVEFVQKAFNDVIDKKTDSKEDPNSGKVINLTDSNFDSELAKKSDQFWLVEFFAPWCGHCKNLEPEWKKAAVLLKDQAILAAVDATTNDKLSKRFALQGFPTIKAFLPNQHSAPFEYNGPRDADGIRDWVLSKLDESPSSKLTELTDQSVFDEAMSKGISILSFLPILYDCDAKCRNNYITLLNDLSKEFASNKWSWLWTEPHYHTQLQEVLNIGGFGYPAMVALSSKKKVYATMKGSFDKKGISEFLKSIASGRASTAPLKTDIPSIDTKTPWNGEDADDNDLNEEYHEEKEL